MFCPNCGTQNPDTSPTCSKCSFALKGASQPKFKGTMLMMNQPQIPVLGASPAAAAPPPGAPPPGVPTGAPPGGPPLAGPPGAPRPSGTGAAPIGGASKLKGTMVGVAPMAGGFGAPAPFQPPSAPPPAGPGAAPPVAAPSGAAPPLGRSAPPQGPAPAAPHEPSGYSPPVPQANVNPLGGTMAADVNPYQQFAQQQGAPQYGGPTQAMPQSPYNPNQYGAPPGQGGPAPGYGPPPGGPPGGYGAPPQQPPGPGAYGAPPVQPGYLQAPQAAYNHQPPPQQGWGPPPEYGQPPPGGFQGQGGYNQPGQGQGLPGGMVPYGAGAPSAGNVLASLQSASGPTRRDPVKTLMPIFVMFGSAIVFSILARILFLFGLFAPIVNLGCAVWLLLIVIPMINEVKAVTKNPDFAWWPIFIPFYSMYWMWILVPQEVAKAKQMLGVQQPVRGIVQYIFIPTYALASDLNDMVR